MRTKCWKSSKYPMYSNQRLWHRHSKLSRGHGVCSLNTENGGGASRRQSRYRIRDSAIIIWRGGLRLIGGGGGAELKPKRRVGGGG